MRQAVIEQDGLHVTVRYFAAARAAAGTESEIVILSPGTTVAELVQRLAR
jgi:molybdopterin synthase sulfur carrier subunit